MRYYAITTNSARGFYERYVCNSHYPADISAIVIKGASDDSKILDDADLQPLSTECKRITQKYPNGANKLNRRDVEGDLVDALSRCFPKIDPRIMTDPGFIRWVNNVACNGEFCKFIEWMYGTESDERNWLVSSSKANVIGESPISRAWLRIQLCDGDVEYAKKGDIDLWRSHIIRNDFARGSDFVKALIDHVSKYSYNGRDELRDFVAALRIWSALASFTHLNYEDSTSILNYIRDNQQIITA